MAYTDKVDIMVVVDRRNGQRKWLEEHHPEVFTEQKHCHEGTPERAYWHYGYQAALTDLLIFLGVEFRGTDRSPVLPD